MEKNPPKYWASLEELHGTPEYQESADKEFPLPPEEQRLTEMDRRSFLKVMGAGMLLATAGCYRRPVEKIIPYVNRPQEVVPGVPDWYASTCGDCSVACGILVKTREGRPIKLEGNPSHPISQGGLCARGQASVLNLYDPDRIKNPLAINALLPNKDLSWEEVDEKIKSKLTEVKQSGGKVYVLSGSIVSPSTVQLIRDFLGSSGQHVSFEGVLPEEILNAQELSYGSKVLPRYRIDKAALVLSFGADFLGTWISPVEFAKGFSKARKVENGSMLRFVAVESALTQTGSNADEYFSVKPGDELAVALALANEIIVQNKQSRHAGDLRVSEALAPYSIEKVSQDTGIKSESLKRVAKELWDAKGKGLVLGGAVKAKNSLALQVAVNLLNSALENDGVTVDATISPSNQVDSSYADLLTLIDDMKNGKVGALFIYKNNPVYSLPAQLGFADALKKVPLSVSFNDRVDETGALVTYVCPDSNYLESWDDANPQKGIYSIVQPVIGTMYKTRSAQDSFIQWGALQEKSWYDFLKAQWQQKVYPQASQGKSFDEFWQEALQVGAVDTLGDRRDGTSGSRYFSSSALSVIPSEASAKGDLFLSLYPSLSMFDGRSSNNAWLQELPDPNSKVTWDNYLSISPQTAEKLKLNNGDIVKMQGDGINAELPIFVQPKLADKTAMVAVGYGRKKIGKIANGVGVDVYPLQKIDQNFISWAGSPITLSKTLSKTTLAITQGHNSAEGRPIVKEETYAQYLQGGKKEHGAGHGGEGGIIPSIWPEHKYDKPYKWGMAIDMSACIGCNACVVGCQSENNIPVVGKEQVIKGRYMHWIRIDRYYSGEKSNPDVSYQPMLCQHCDNAPCESVCPVLATVHNDEGLNTMVYNRCVGTRYCANNCPYKVRRFNFFDYSKQYVEPLNLVLNPDITTRSRGVMEKCTFCMQRIRTEKDKAKAHGTLVADGAIKTACQQSCPTDAIVFGNTHDEHSLVSKLRANPRGFHVLEELNVKPQITYLEKVRNTLG